MSSTDPATNHRDLVLASRIRCGWASAISLVVWAIGLLFLAMGLSEPIDNPAGLGLYVIAPVVIALPFGLCNSFTTYPLVMRLARYRFLAARKIAQTVLAIILLVSSVWLIALRESETLWHSTGPAWFLFTVFAPPAMIGVVFATRVQGSRIVE